MPPTRSIPEAGIPDLHPLFVYGTLRKGSEHPMARRLMREGEWSGSGSAEGKLLLVQNSPSSRYPGLIEGSGRVRGDVFRVGTPLLTLLDAYEGCSEADPQPHPYQRVLRLIDRDDGESILAWTYLYTAIIGSSEEIESGDFLEWLR